MNLKTTMAQALVHSLRANQNIMRSGPSARAIRCMLNCIFASQGVPSTYAPSEASDS
jgi:hypothetical protein